MSDPAAFGGKSAAGHREDRAARRWVQPEAAVMVVLLATLVLLLAFEDASGPLGLALRMSLGLGAILSIERLGLGGGLVGGALGLLALASPGEPTAVVFLSLVPLVWAASLGRIRLLIAMSGWTVLAGAAYEVGRPESLTLVLSALSGWTYLILIAVVAGLAIREIREQRARQLQRIDRRALLQRQEIARELHDTVARDLTRLVLQSEQALARSRPDQPLSQELRNAIAQTRRSLADLRTLMRTMREDLPARTRQTRRPVGVQETLEERMAALQHAGFQVSRLIELDLEEVPAVLLGVMSRIVREATMNIVRHGQPGTECSIMIGGSPAQVEMIFVNEVAVSKFRYSNDVGLLTIRDLLQPFGGSMEAGPIGRRWILQVTLPCRTSPFEVNDDR